MPRKKTRRVDLPEGPTSSPHPDGEQLLQDAIPRALTLAGSIRDEGHEAVAAVTADLTRDELVALAVALAAMVDVDAPASDLLAWVDEPEPTPAQLRAWHAAWKRGEQDDVTREGERLYQAWRHREQRARFVAAS
ncbi:hypothetical protein [Pseudokineococcus lusitanus]|uniref:Uncharacterized protein n=1 Tax=Pseudokineococcus lusitanus TaxID=763993 RepID=A0A3N1HUB0_9ACTN|nr:hypothetical protein [Pseudokineococcus lusitanus]ROP45932.1 hypothetical protein EDC03_0547 [Pseudokineococcus lusitanus]